MSHLRLIAAAALALVLVLPATALAATFDVGGTVTTADGAPAAGAEITILVLSTDEIDDQIYATATDENGAWALQLDVEPGEVLEVNGTGQSITTEPDAKGCVTTTTPTSGLINVTIPAEGTVPAIDFALDDPLSGTVCSTVTPPDTGGGNGGGGNGGGAAPDKQKPDTAGVTPPSTDTLPSARKATTAGNATFLVLGVLVGLTGAVLVLTNRRRPDRR